MNIEQTVKIFKALMDGPVSRLELAQRTGANPKSVGKLLVELKAQKMVYIISYMYQCQRCWKTISAILKEKQA